MRRGQRNRNGARLAAAALLLSFEQCGPSFVQRVGPLGMRHLKDAQRRGDIRDGSGIEALLQRGASLSQGQHSKSRTTSSQLMEQPAERIHVASTCGLPYTLQEFERPLEVGVDDGGQVVRRQDRQVIPHVRSRTVVFILVR